jgi:hypothetical protein
MDTIKFIKHLISSILMILSSPLLGQVDSNIIFANPETPPFFPGGDKALFCFLEDQLDHDLLAEGDVNGTVVASFDIDTNGAVQHLEIKGSLNKEIDNEFLRVLGFMPLWESGEINGKIAVVQMYLPLKLPFKNRCLD